MTSAHAAEIDHGEAVRSTDAFYEQNASKYFERTVNADLSHLYEPFTSRLSARARILDLGCGSGRDLRAFRARGFRAIGMDVSTKLVRMASEYSGAPCVVGRIEELSYEREFDAIWACASLLHIPKSQISTCATKIRNALVPTGLLYASVQAGNGERVDNDERFFAYYEPDEFKLVFTRAGFDVDLIWLTKDALQDRSVCQWINLLAKRG